MATKELSLLRFLNLMSGLLFFLIKKWCWAIFFVKWIMISMRSQCKMLAFLSRLVGDKVFCNRKVSADFQANRPNSHGNCIFYLQLYNPEVEDESPQEKDWIAAHFRLIMFKKRRRNDTWLLTVEPDRRFFASLCNS